MDKKNVQKMKVKKVLTEKKFRLPYFIFMVTIKIIDLIFVIVFFCKKLKNIFSMEINGSFRKRAKGAKGAFYIFL
jgi:hypothetical protein